MTSKSLFHLVFGVLFCGLFLQTAMAQISIGGKPYSFAGRTHTEALPPVLMPGINLGKLQAEDLLDEQAGQPPRFGEPIAVNLNMNNSGVWETLPDGGRLWRLSIMAAGAKSINLLYNDFYLPSSGVLYIYSADRKHVIGGFTSRNNKSDRVFATGLVYSDHIVLEYYETPANSDKAQVDPQQPVSIGINYVVHGYRHISLDKHDLEKAFDDSGDCNVNTICSQGDNWRDEIKSVALMLIGGIRWCTGYLVNNTAEDCRPLFLTANHCLSTFDAISNPNANTFSFVWRYESPNCTPDTNGPLNMTTSGATILANPGSPGDVISSDFALLELAESPKDAGYDVYFAGFDATATAPAATTGIHHPAGDVKKISMENDAVTATNYGGTGGTPTHWRVADWDSGTTEGGSSGSPIFSNATKRAMGFLSGGFAACGNNLPDWYGQMAYSWDNNGASDSRRRLRDHLDPGGLATFVDGSAAPCGTPPSCNTYSSAANLNLAIPDNNPAGVSSTINVGASGTISQLKCVTVNLAHTFTGDLVATLTHVSSGTSVQLFRRLNALSMTSFGESSNLDGTYTFCATGASFANAANAGGTDYVIPPGTYAQSSSSLQVTPPDNPNVYGSFMGLNINGDWRLTLSDYATADFGTLRNWSFEVCTGAACIPATAYNVTGDGSSCAPNGPTLPIGLDNSQTGYTYELFRDGNSVTTAAGTGNPLIFGSYNIPGTYTVVATEDGNSTCTADMSGSAVITQDVTPPSITCPGTQTVSCASAVPPVNINDVIINSGGPATVIHVGDAISNQTCANRYTITRTYRATDVCGNPIDCEQTITVNDQTPPMVTAGSINPCYATQAAAEAAAIAATTASADNCGGAVTKTASTTGNCSAEIIVTATDVCGNSASVTYNTRIDNTPPTVTAGTIAACYSTVAAAEAAAIAATTTSDNCTGTITKTASTMGTCPAVITITGTDGCGNSASVTYNTCIDNIPPMATCHNQTITFNGQESITLNANDLVTVSDNCGTPSITLSPSFITCQQVGQQVPVTITVKDASNNTVTCTATITVAGLPCGWSQNPNGVNCANGNSIAYNAATGVYTATSTGCFYGPPFTGDATAFAQRTLCGDGSITALVTGINPLAGGWAGIVMRENNTAGAKKAQLMTNLGSDHRREFRTTTNGSAQVQQFPNQSRYWLRITRVGNQFTMLVSSNGVNWFPAGAQNIVMGNCIEMGLVATNYTANSTVTATFSNVSFTGSNSGLGSPFTPDVFTPLHSPLTPEFDVYPNPTDGELNVDLTQYVGRSVRLEVYSLEGKLLQFSELDEVQNTLELLDLKGLQNGMYLVKVKSAGLQDATRRVVLTRG